MFGMRLACNYNKYTGRESNLDPIEGLMQHVPGILYIQYCCSSSNFKRMFHSLLSSNKDDEMHTVKNISQVLVPLRMMNTLIFPMVTAHN